MLARAGVDWTIDNERAAYTQTDGYRIARAQAHLLEIHYSDFWSTVWGIAALQETPSICLASVDRCHE